MKQRHYLGCSGWYYNDWKGKFYPDKLNKSKWLEYYSKQFNTVEVNNTFYRFPSKKNLQKWYEKTPDEFQFTLKVNQLITHRKIFKDTQDTIKRFYNLAEILEEKLSCVLFQIPPQKTKDIQFLKDIAKQLDPSINNVIEFRDISWFDHEVYDILKEFNIIFCSVSSNFPQELITTSKIAYIRFHGCGMERYRYYYSKEELNKWGEMIKKSNAKSIFCYFNNDYNANAPQNCLVLNEILEA